MDRMNFTKKYLQIFWPLVCSFGIYEFQSKNILQKEVPRL